MEQLPLFLSLRGKPVLVLGEGEAADAKRRLVEEAGAVVVDDPDGVHGARIAFVAMEAGAESVAGKLRAAGMLVNVVDQPALCDFTVPAIVDRSPLVLAIGTGGASASLAKALKERLDQMLPTGLGTLARAMRDARGAVANRYPKIAERRAFWAEALVPGGALDPLTPHGDAARAVSAALQGVETEPAEATEVWVGPDGAEGLTLRELRLLAAADRVVVGDGIGAEVMALVRRDAERVAGTALPADASGRTVLLRRERSDGQGDRK